METWTLFKKSINDLTKSDYSSIEIKKNGIKLLEILKVIGLIILKTYLVY